MKLDSPSLAWTRDGKTLFVFGDRGLFLIDPAKNSMKRIADGEFHGQIDWLATT